MQELRDRNIVHRKTLVWVEILQGTEDKIAFTDPRVWNLQCAIDIYCLISCLEKTEKVKLTSRKVVEKIAWKGRRSEERERVLSGDVVHRR